MLAVTLANGLKRMQNQRVGKGARNALPTLVNRTFEVFKMTKISIPLEAHLTQAELKRWLSYDPQSGEFHWIRQSGHRKPGDAAGSVKVKSGTTYRRWGYVTIGVRGRVYMAHRLAWLYVHGRWPTEFIDHIDGVRTNNRISNLRECSSRENAQARHVSTGRSSKYMGVCWSKSAKKWQATIRIDGKPTYLGVFATEIDAADAYQNAKRAHHPFAFDGARL